MGPFVRTVGRLPLRGKGDAQHTGGGQSPPPLLGCRRRAVSRRRRRQGPGTGAGSGLAPADGVSWDENADDWVWLGVVEERMAR